MLYPCLSSSRAARAVSRLLPLLLLALAATGPRAAAQAPLIYGLNETGSVTVNGTLLDKLPSGFNPDSPNQNQFQRWQLFAVSGADRYALRLDGQLYKNGKSLYKLPFGTTVTPAGSFIFAWIGLSLGDSGVYALRQDGLLTLNGVATVTLPRGNFAFTACLAVPNPQAPGTSDVYSLRSDGTVFKNTLNVTAFLKFTGGAGLNVSVTNPSSNAADGAGSETVWVDLTVDPVQGTLRGLRFDGKVSSGTAPPVTPPAVDADLQALPFPTLQTDLNNDEKLNNNRYRSLAFTDSGGWIAVRGNGQLFTGQSLLVPLVDLPSDGNNPIDDTYLDIAIDGENFWTIRWDGNVYADTGTVPVLKLTKDRYRNIALSHVDPDLTSFKNPKPLASTYTATVVEHTPVTIPVYAIDIEKTGPSLGVSLLDPLKKPLPAGLTFNADPDADPLTPPTITWDDPTPKGSYTIPIVVTDGVNKPKTYNYKIKVILADSNPLKNKKPVFSKVKNTQALVGFAYELQILAVDPDPGDTVTLSVDTSKEPFLTLGAAFDPDTGIFTWTPTFDDIGKTKVKFTALDALNAKATYTVTIKVVSGLIFS